MATGILAVQGAFIEHEHILNGLGADTIQLRQKSDLYKDFDRLVLPGGESTVQGKLLKDLGMFDILKEKIENGMPVLATCAGLILLAENISNDTRTYFQTLPVTVKRNAYGRQLGSFHYNGDIKGLGNFPMEFIRAPYIESAGDNVEILAYVQNKAVAARYKKQLGFSFHPELCNDNRIHKMFLEL